MTFYGQLGARVTSPENRLAAWGRVRQGHAGTHDGFVGRAAHNIVNGYNPSAASRLRVNQTGLRAEGEVTRRRGAAEETAFRFTDSLGKHVSLWAAGSVSERRAGAFSESDTVRSFV